MSNTPQEAALPAQTALRALNEQHRPRGSPPPVYEVEESQPEPWTYDRSKILWLELPEGIANCARLGVVNSTYGPLFILRVRDEVDDAIEREISGLASDMFELAEGIIHGVELVNGLADDLTAAASRIAEAQARRVG